jgi:hypothetical protein
MDTSAILAALLSERDRLNQAIAALETLGGTTSSLTKPGRKPATATVPTAKKRPRFEGGWHSLFSEHSLAGRG